MNTDDMLDKTVIVSGTHRAKKNGMDVMCVPYDIIGKYKGEDETYYNIQTNEQIQNCQKENVDSILTFEEYFNRINYLNENQIVYVSISRFPLKEVRKLRKLLDRDIEIKIVKNNCLRFKRSKIN